MQTFTDLDDEYNHIFKFLLIGESGVGKSSLLLRYCDNSFTSSFISTIGVDFKIKTVKYKGETIKIQLWDTAGQERFRTISQSFYRGCNGIILVYDCNDIDSFNKIEYWYDQIAKYAEKDCIVLLIGNKVDLEKKVTTQEGEDMALKYDWGFIETSAKDSININEAFGSMVRRCLQKKQILKDKDKNSDSEKQGEYHVSPSVDITSDNNKNKGFFCCGT